MSRSLLFGLRVLVASIPSCSPAWRWAQDQPWLSDRRYTEGRASRSATSSCTPAWRRSSATTSNYFHRSDDEDPIGASACASRRRSRSSTLGQQRRERAPPRRCPVPCRHPRHVRRVLPGLREPGRPGRDDGQPQRRRPRGLQRRLRPRARRCSATFTAGLTRNIDPSNAALQRGELQPPDPRRRRGDRLCTRRRSVRLALRLQLHRHVLRESSTASSTTSTTRSRRGSLAFPAALGAHVRRPLRDHQLPGRDAEDRLAPDARAHRLQRPRSRTRSRCW